MMDGQISMWPVIALQASSITIITMGHFLMWPSWRELLSMRMGANRPAWGRPSPITMAMAIWISLRRIFLTTLLLSIATMAMALFLIPRLQPVSDSILDIWAGESHSLISITTVGRISWL